ncbi:MAG: EAL domain-containing protein [Denitromonas halophila]|nr:MAG: EAL domain-containing protein [Denitromonas halophila]
MTTQNAPSENTEVTPPESTDRSWSAMKRATIMMVDDEPITLEIIQMFLEDAGYTHFVLVSDSREAMDMVERERPDIVLLDLLMPHVNGFDILAQIRNHERFEHLPVVVLTSSSDAPTKLKALEMGATDFLAKPVDESELVLRVRNTLAAKAYQDRLTYIDVLTGLPNRRMLIDRLDWAMKHAQRYQQTGALLQIDIDRFRETKEALGPSRADELLQGIARRLDDACRDSDLLATLSEAEASAGLARWGGDEFPLLLLGNLTAESIARIARRLLVAMTEPFVVDTQEIFISITIGIATFPEDGTDIDTVQHSSAIAARALQATQANPHGAFQFYSKELNARTASRLNMEAELRRALDRNELVLYFQPKYTVDSETLIGAECLLRWQHPERGQVSPMAFIPLAEETGLIMEIGQRVIDEACRQHSVWQSQGLNPGQLAVNVSVQQFQHGAFVDGVRGALKRYGVAPRHLKLELTESLLMREPQNIANMLNELRTLGVQLSIDDFGTGYSSLSYLSALPIDELKIDRSFLTNVVTRAESAAIVRAILALAGSLNMSVVAEGVETPEQLAFLKEHRCTAFQGFLFSRPVDAEAFAKLIAASPANAPHRQPS